MKFRDIQEPVEGTAWIDHQYGGFNLITSEKYEVSYLKHESLHFTDMNDYPNLSSADLEYRSKVIELIYCTEKTIYDKMIQDGLDDTRAKSLITKNREKQL